MLRAVGRAPGGSSLLLGLVGRGDQRGLAQPDGLRLPRRAVPPSRSSPPSAQGRTARTRRGSGRPTRRSRRSRTARPTRTTSTRRLADGERRRTGRYPRAGVDPVEVRLALVAAALDAVLNGKRPSADRAREYDGERPGFSNAGWDVKTPDGERIEGKAMRVAEGGYASRGLRPIRKPDCDASDRRRVRRGLRRDRRSFGFRARSSKERVAVAEWVEAVRACSRSRPTRGPRPGEGVMTVRRARDRPVSCPAALRLRPVAITPDEQ